MPNDISVNGSPLWVASFYIFRQLLDYTSLRDPLLKVLQRNQVKGSVLLASEGINASLSGTNDALADTLNWLAQKIGVEDIAARYSATTKHPFHRTKVKLKREIVTMGQSDLRFCPGIRVAASDWNTLIRDPHTLLIDTRNDYEFAIGAFRGAINPQLENFRQFPDYFAHNLKAYFLEDASATHKMDVSAVPKRYTRLAMYCTGGIRCEKASSFVKASGVDEVYHLQGGILAYLAEVEPRQSLWEGECFVFDNRVALTAGLAKGSFDQCHACRYPIDSETMHSPLYISGVQCPRCAHSRSELQHSRARERVRQIALAQARGNLHLGVDLAHAKRLKHTSITANT